jgi:hypothetical protein
MGLSAYSVGVGDPQAGINFERMRAEPQQKDTDRAQATQHGRCPRATGDIGYRDTPSARN